MKRLTVLLMAMAALIFAACSEADRAKMEADKLDSYELTAAQRTVAEAVIVGYKKEMGTTLLRSRDIGSAACYAKTVDMPRRFEKAHLLYLADYTAIDADFYPYFKQRGIGEQAAYDMSQRVLAGFEACSMSGLLKRAREN